MQAEPRMTRTILAVEDDPVIRRAIQRAVGGAAEVRFAPTGQAAIDALAGSAQPVFMLLDFMLPDMDGQQVLSRVRAEPRTQTLPIVMFSSVADPARVRKALSSGANSWVAKTDDPKAFEAAVQAICSYWMHVNTSP